MTTARKGDAFTPQVFERLGRAKTSGDAITSSQLIVDELVRRLNRSMSAARLSTMRARFGLNAGDAFLTAGNYIHGQPSHWYVFHRNGRWEPQFNIGMFGGGPGRPAYLRFGLGSALHLGSADPEREAGLRRLRSFFGNLQWLARSNKRTLLTTALQTGRPLTECIGAVAERSPHPATICSWLGGLDNAIVTWVFAGRILSPDIPDEGDVLADMSDLVFDVTRTLEAWLPVWEATMVGAE